MIITVPETTVPNSLTIPNVPFASNVLADTQTMFSEMNVDPRVPSPAAHGATRHQMKRLTSFNGDHATYPTWRAKLSAKLVIDGDHMGGDYGQIAAIFNALTGPAKVTCGPFFTALLDRPTATVQEARDYLNRVYADESQQQLAFEQWSCLRQGTNSFDVFFAEFERLLARAGGLKFDERMKIAQLKRSTSAEIVRLAVGHANYATLGDQASHFRRIVQDLAALYGPSTVFATSYTPAVTTLTANGGGPMDIDVPGSFNTNTRGQGGRGRGYRRCRGRGGNGNGASTRVNPNGSVGPGLPTDAQLRGRVARIATREEIAARHEAGACYRCGRLYCEVAVCPLAAPRYPAAPHVKKEATVAYVEPDVNTMFAPAAES